MLTEDELDVEFGIAPGKVSGFGDDKNLHGRRRRGSEELTAGPCHGFAPAQRHGEWFNAGHADNIFGGTAYGRRFLPAFRSARVRSRLVAAASVSGAYAVAELTAAHLSGSTALLADAMHMLSDFASYAISLAIIWVTSSAAAKAKGRATSGNKKDGNCSHGHRHTHVDEEAGEAGAETKEPSPVIRRDAAHAGDCSDSSVADAEKAIHKKGRRELTYGYVRLEVLSALAIILIVWIATGALVVEAAKRLADPPEVDGMTVLLTATGGLVVNAVLLTLLRNKDDGAGGENVPGHGHSHGSGELSKRAMFLHVLGDTAGTLVVAAGGAIVWGTGGGVYDIVDPLCTLIFACVVCATTYPFLVELVWVLMESAPKGLDVSEIAKTLLREMPDLAGVHCVHVWQLTPSELCLTAHIIVDVPPLPPKSAAPSMNSMGSGGFGSIGGMGMGMGMGGSLSTPKGAAEEAASHYRKYEEVLKKATRVCARRFGIHHTTLQVTAAAASGGLPHCDVSED